MKFIKKPAIAASLSTIPHYHSSNSTNADSLFSYLFGSVIQFFTLLKRWCDGLSRVLMIRINFVSNANKSPAFTDWTPLIKASSNNPNDMRSHHYGTAHLKNRSILCVGGRIKLYSQYERLIAARGGHFLAFHGDANDSLDHLLPLLEMADLIICPVDCVNHEAFLIAKRFCRCSQKPCVLLDRSDVRTFNAGIQALSKVIGEVSNRSSR